MNSFGMRRAWSFSDVILAMTVLGAALSMGCGSKLGAEVSGAVTLDGRPFGGPDHMGTVIFASATEVRNPAEGAIMADGSYHLRTTQTEGLRPGRYKVAVRVLLQPEVAEGDRTAVELKHLTQSKYEDPGTSGLEFEVKPGKQTIDIPLASK